jgi:hypothetical protein
MTYIVPNSVHARDIAPTWCGAKRRGSRHLARHGVYVYHESGGGCGRAVVRLATTAVTRRARARRNSPPAWPTRSRR